MPGKFHSVGCVANQADSACHPFGVDKWVVGCNGA